MAKQIFVNLPVKNLDKTKAFFAALGFTFNPQFTNESGACMVIGENIFAMLLTEPFYKNFTQKEIADASKTSEVILALSVESRDAVNEMAGKVNAADGKLSDVIQEHGWMYGRSFEDVDNHIWEVLWTDPAGPEGNDTNSGQV